MPFILALPRSIGFSLALIRYECSLAVWQSQTSSISTRTLPWVRRPNICNVQQSSCIIFKTLT
ncbi:hypothetical protein GDO81_016292 [Engystomops pustulosus]|uniref:Uncharacterized protein n=1 Tax=Engystomops pustulosus TaxID=76066 RepID=A0AAV7AVN3_ENGPU|nr:hypothetical protein GDO81_016292 [Engystomops pustulosus]